jgi:hypothetical protein
LVSVGLPTQDVAKRAQEEIAIRWRPHAFQPCQQQALGLFIRQMVLDTLSQGVETLVEGRFSPTVIEGDF